jgi:hypothetical protein
MKTKILIFGIVGIVLIACVAAVFMLRHKPKGVYQLKSPPETTAHADPPAALAGILSAASKGDGEKVFASFSPRMQEKLQRQFGKQIEQQGISMAALVSQMGKHWSSGANTYQIVNQRTNEDDLVIMDVQLQGRKKPQAFTMKNIDGAWMLDDFRD